MHFLLTCTSLCHYWHHNNGARSPLPFPFPPPPSAKSFQILMQIYTTVKFSISETVFLQQHKVTFMVSESVLLLTQNSAGPAIPNSTEIAFWTFPHSQSTFLCPFSQVTISARKCYPVIQIHQTGVSRQRSTDCHLPPPLQTAGNPSSQPSLLRCFHCSSLQRVLLSQQLHPWLSTQGSQQKSAPSICSLLHSLESSQLARLYKTLSNPRSKFNPISFFPRIKQSAVFSRHFLSETVKQCEQILIKHFITIMVKQYTGKYMIKQDTENELKRNILGKHN